MKKKLFIFISILAISCNKDEPNIQTDKTSINLITGVNFRNTYMVDANLSNCNLTDTQFGEYPSIKENTNLLRCVIFSNNGKYILGYGLDKKFVMWDANTFKLANTFIGHIKWIQCATFRPDD